MFSQESSTAYIRYTFNSQIRKSVLELWSIVLVQASCLTHTSLLFHHLK
uniref:Uncharacterized protein n=1 Tax=Anguilla anguilla TaxID=7936 RepID=A0A0E9WWH6_ANGAN